MTSSDGDQTTFELEIPAPDEFPATLHAPFLERAGKPSGNDVSELALGAFLALRVVDLFSDRHADPAAHTYQIRAALNYLTNLYPSTAEVGHLEQVVRAADTALQTDEPGALWAPLSTFAGWLEREIRLPEALDVLDTALRVAETTANGAVKGIQLHRGRVLRVAGRLDEATAAYGAASALAAMEGDTHTEFLSQIGRGIVLQRVGNLPAAEGVLTSVLHDAAREGDRDAEARASHDLAVNAVLMENPAHGVSYAFRAYSLYDHPEDRHRALADLGTALQRLGHYEAAKDAYELVLGGTIPVGMRMSTQTELLELAGLTADRVSFERQRRALEAVEDKMPPPTKVDYEIKLGIGLASFGQHQRAHMHLTAAVTAAEHHHLNELLFRAEAALLDLETDPSPGDGAHTVDWNDHFPEVSVVADRLQSLRAQV